MAQNEGRMLRRAPQLSKRYLVTGFVTVILSSTLFGLAVHGLNHITQSVLAANTAQAAMPDTNNGSDAVLVSQGERVQTTTSPTASSQTVPSCTRISYKLPTAINLVDLPAGLTVIEDSPQYYTIYGNTAEEQREQLQRCTPVDEYAAAASYQISWQYSYSVVDAGLCKIVQPKIGLHLNMVLPKWTEISNGASAATRQNWASFASNLTEHERGHYKISRQFAQTMLGQLQQLSPQSCATIEDKASGVLAAKLKQLEAAQQNYDATTDHGTTQGAILP